MNETSTPLPPQVVDLLLAIASRLGKLGHALDGQVQSASAVTLSPTYIEIGLPEGVEQGLWSDGPLDLKPLIVDEANEPIGEVLVWIESGRVTLLEQAWFTDDPPTGWPQLQAVRFP